MSATDLFPELARVRQHVSIPGRLPTLTQWFARAEVCAWVRAMDAWKAGEGDDEAPPPPPAVLFAEAGRPAPRSKLALLTVALVLFAGCGEYGETIVCRAPDAGVDAGPDAGEAGR